MIKLLVRQSLPAGAITIHMNSTNQWYKQMIKLLVRQSLPTGAMSVPRTETHPAELSFAGVVTADHVITPTTLLNSGTALGTFLK